MTKDQEITSLNHKNGVLEKDIEKLEENVSKHKKDADEGIQHGTQNEALQRKVTVLEEEAEEADRNLRETNEKYASSSFHFQESICTTELR